MTARFLRTSGLGLLLFVLAACDDPSDPSEGYVPADQVGSVQVDFPPATGRWQADPLVIDSAKIVNDTLRVFVNHGGGCAPHRYAAIANNGWLESHPVQVGVVIAHQDFDDMCDALIHAQLRFDLAPLRAAYQRSYGAGSAELIIRLREAAATNRPAITIRYSF